MLFIPNVLLVYCQIFLASWRFSAYIMTYLRRRVHWNPISVSLKLSKPASWTVRPAFEIPVSAPKMAGNPRVAWGIVPWIFQMKRVLCLFIPVFASQSKFLMVISLPPFVLFPQMAKKEQWILFLFIKFFKNLTVSKILSSTMFRTSSLLILAWSLRNSSSNAYIISLVKSPG